MAKGKKSGGGSRKGRPNRATASVREAIKQVLETNTENFSKWLAAVAEGEKEYRFDDDGQPIMDANGEQLFDWLRRPEPGTALKLAMDMNEYHMPKLARTTVDGELAIKASLTIRD